VTPDRFGTETTSDVSTRYTETDKMCDISVTGAWGRIDGSVTAAESPRGSDTQPST